jgi:hypothetical protein
LENLERLFPQCQGHPLIQDYRCRNQNAAALIGGRMKAKSILMSLVLFGGGATPCLATAVPPPVFSRAIEQNAQLELTTSIIEQFSCSPDFVNLHLRLTYKNTGKEPIILDRMSATIVDRYLVSRSMKDAANRKYAQEGRADDFGGNYGVDPKSHPDLSHFVIIRPGEAHSVDGPWTTAGLVVNNAPPQTKGGLVIGTYFLQVQVDTWPYFSDVKQLRINRQDHGYLWTESLISVPLPFTIEGSRPIRKCN